jgi:hypothetical protein
MSARIAPKRTITPPERTLRSTMINAIGAMHATLRAKKRPEEEVNFRVEIKKQRGKQRMDDEEDEAQEHTRRARTERGHRA